MNDNDTSQTSISPMDVEEPHGESRSRSWAERLRPHTFRARITLAVVLIVIAMMAALIVTQNLIVSHTAQRDGGDIVMCMNMDGTMTVTNRRCAARSPRTDVARDSSTRCSPCRASRAAPMRAPAKTNPRLGPVTELPTSCPVCMMPSTGRPKTRTIEASR
ncbi:hypothetical protein [Bifidobacterium platyrrhinorum]|uniref:hypothetical protein n=1 Tax=Bifidobacterium platyrrhinorum TaxID=2661628 RepID=UPI0013D3C83F|nr:hypothetical protein [Bifidobacterium platyrrhinorum]